MSSRLECQPAVLLAASIAGRQRGAGAVGFVPAIIRPQEPPAEHSSGALARPRGRVEIVLGEPRRLIVDEHVSASALARVIGVLEGR